MPGSVSFLPGCSIVSLVVILLAALTCPGSSEVAFFIADPQCAPVMSSWIPMKRARRLPLSPLSQLQTLIALRGTGKMSRLPGFDAALAAAEMSPALDGKELGAALMALMTDASST
jgi:hypothetical protein